MNQSTTLKLFEGTASQVWFPSKESYLTVGSYLTNRTLVDSRLATTCAEFCANRSGNWGCPPLSQELFWPTTEAGHVHPHLL